MGAERIYRRFRDLRDVVFGTPVDGDVVQYDLGTDSIVLGPAPSGAPSGPAGGVLSGTYPDPGFAADMATQAELAAAAATLQPLDSDLTAIAALTTTVFGRTLLELANAAAGRTALGLVIGTDVQAQDSDLQAIAALTTTAYGRSLLEAANAAALRTLAGLVIGTDVPGQAAFNDHSGRHEDGGPDEITIAGLAGISAELAVHLADATDAHDASAISVLDAGGNFTAAEVEGALVELIAGDDAIESDLADHLADPADAHDASAVSVVPFATIAATTVQGALEEIVAEASPGVTDHGALTGLADDDHPQYTTTAEAQALVDAHVNDAADAHDAAAVTFVPAGTIEATTVQAAIEEVAIEAGSAGAPTTADYLVGTTQGDLSAEIVVGTSPGGELGGTWVSPTVDATHSGSSHAGVQAAAEATAQAALDAHTGDATDAHDASAISIVDAAGDFAATEVEGALAELQAADEVDEAALAAHLADASDAHDASAVSFSPTGTISATNVQAAIAEVASEATGGVGDILALYVFAR